MLIFEGIKKAPRGLFLFDFGLGLLGCLQAVVSSLEVPLSLASAWANALDIQLKTLGVEGGGDGDFADLSVCHLDLLARQRHRYGVSPESLSASLLMVLL